MGSAGCNENLARGFLCEFLSSDGFAEVASFAFITAMSLKRETLLFGPDALGNDLQIQALCTSA